MNKRYTCSINVELNYFKCNEHLHTNLRKKCIHKTNSTRYIRLYYFVYKIFACALFYYLNIFKIPNNLNKLSYFILILLKYFLFVFVYTWKTLTYKFDLGGSLSMKNYVNDQHHVVKAL